MDWYQVVLPEGFERWSKAQLFTVLLHEWAHRVIAPVSPLRGSIWQQAACRQGLTIEQAQFVANAAADAWVDRACLEHSRWGKRFRAGQAEDMAEFAGSIPGSEEGTTRETGIPFSRVWYGFNRRLLDSVVGEAERGPGTGDGCAEPALDAEESMLVDSIWAVLYEGAASAAERVSALAALIGPLLPPHPACALLSQQLVFGDYTGQASATLLREARKAGLTSPEIEELFGAQELARLHREAGRLALYAKAMPAVKRFLRHRAHMAFSGYHPWAVGRPVRELDLLATLQRGGQIIPSVNTLSRRYERRGHQHGLGGGAAVLVVDDSGSTGGSVLEREKEAAFAVIAAARVLGDPVGCVVFGSRVTTSLQPTTRYTQIEDAVAGLVAGSGGTALAPALTAALEMGADGGGLAVLLMTDARIADAQVVAPILRALPTSVRLTAFCFGDVDAAGSALPSSSGHRVRVLVASPSQPFAESALEEIYGY